MLYTGRESSAAPTNARLPTRRHGPAANDSKFINLLPRAYFHRSNCLREEGVYVVAIVGWDAFYAPHFFRLPFVSFDVHRLR